ncbi:bifunctional metallophosphatase/5'-nucleotidase [Bacillaceae bacterium Marseille-Q3522]|nr:bifunctional metallophosphatase/5'-nucleotidase [Bacillaceae bacterium Marseille-Q3522]
MKQIVITVLETSDVHGNILPINYGDNKNVHLGFAKIASIIKKEKCKNNNVILIDNGDVMQGTPLTYYFARFSSQRINPLAKILNYLHYDAAVIGNHEFNYGFELLQHLVRDSMFPWLSANIIHKQSKEPVFGIPYFIKNIAGVKVAILGVTTHYIPNWENPVHIQDLEFQDALETTKRWVKQIRKHENPDVVIVSYHGGFEKDLDTGVNTEKPTGENQAYRICLEVDGIDLLLTGHQHRFIANYVNGIPVLQPGNNGKMLGKATIKLRFEKKWQVEEIIPELISVEKAETDEDIVKLTEIYEEETQSWLDKPIGRISGDMLVHDPFKLRLEDNALIEFINKVQMAVSGAEISNTALFNNQSPGFPEHVTMRDIVGNYMYPNTLKVIRISGQDIKDALERSASYFIIDDSGEIQVNPLFSTPKPQHYNYDMWEGIDYTFDISKPVGNRVTRLRYKDSPVVPDRCYDVVMNNYRAGGGGEYPMFKNKPVIKDIPTDMAELIANYILDKGTITATVNHNWKVIW